MSNMIPSKARHRPVLACAAAAACLMGAAVIAEAASKQPPPLQAGSVGGDGVYQMSGEELAMDCKRLTGRMQIRILQLREMLQTNKSSSFSNGLRETAAPVTGLLLGKTTAYSNDPVKRRNEDVAMLTAYNKQLAVKGCKTYNLDAELNAKPGSLDLPRPTQPSGQPAQR